MLSWYGYRGVSRLPVGDGIVDRQHGPCWLMVMVMAMVMLMVIVMAMLMLMLMLMLMVVMVVTMMMWLWNRDMRGCCRRC